MNYMFVADGYLRFLRGKRAAASESIEDQYSAALAKAGLNGKGKIRERMAQECLRREKMLRHKPSPGTLW